MNWFIPFVYMPARTGTKQKAFDINKYYTKDRQCFNVQNRQEINSKSWHFSMWFSFLVFIFIFVLLFKFNLSLFFSRLFIPIRFQYTSFQFSKFSNLLNERIAVYECACACAFSFDNSISFFVFLWVFCILWNLSFWRAISFTSFHIWCLLVSFVCPSVYRVSPVLYC